MKILKAKIEIVHPNGGDTQYVGYPQEWLDNKEKIPAILYPNDRAEEIQEGGKIYKILFPVVPDDLAGVLLKNSFIELASKDEIVTYSEKYWPKREIETDPLRVKEIVLKVVRGEQLTQEDKDALDPTNPAAGISMSKSFLEVARDYGADNV